MEAAEGCIPDFRPSRVVAAAAVPRDDDEDGHEYDQNLEGDPIAPE